MICERCGRLLNRATGRCVCDDYEGEAPPPVVTTHAPPEADQPISRAGVMAALDLSDRPTRPVAAPAEPVVPAAPPPPVRGPGEAVGVLRSVRWNRKRIDVVLYDKSILLASRGAPTNVAIGPLAAQDATSRIIDDALVDDVSVREDSLSGKATIHLRSGERLVLSWRARPNRGSSAEDLLASAFPGKVDQGSSEVTVRTVRAMAALGVVMLLLVAGWMGLSSLLAGDPPPPPPPAPPPTLAPAEQAARAELEAVCGAWTAFAGLIPPGERPDPAALRPVADAMKPRFDAAATALGDYAPARDEVAYLQDYARRPADAVARESSSRVAYAVRTVSAACTRAGTAP